jgi:CRISPR system Cascade subunit CasD
MANTLLLRLEGPLQSWGERARWSVRDTAPEPTKSGVVGLLACAMGLWADDDVRALGRKVELGVRCDRPGTRLRDYHTVVGGVMSAEGKIKINASTKAPETLVSERSYLCDAVFLAAVRSADEDLIARLAAAVQSPTWPLYLGRKSCPPSAPVYVRTGDYASLEAALESVPSLRPSDVGAVTETDASTVVRAVIECGRSEGVQRNDQIESRSCRTYAPRYTRDVLLTMRAAPEEGACT